MHPGTRATIAVFMIVALAWVVVAIQKAGPEIHEVTPTAVIYQVEVEPHAWSEVLRIPEGHAAHLLGRAARRRHSVAVFTESALEDYEARGGGLPDPLRAVYGAFEWDLSLDAHTEPAVVVIDNSVGSEVLAVVVAAKID